MKISVYFSWIDWSTNFESKVLLKGLQNSEQTGRSTGDSSDDVHPGVNPGPTDGLFSGSHPMGNIFHQVTRSVLTVDSHIIGLDLAVISGFTIDG